MTPEQKDKAVELALSGGTIREICRVVVVSTTGLYNELLRDSSFKTRFEQAREQGIETQVDSILDIAREEPDVQRARVVTDSIKWIASKRKPNTYGDKITMDINGQVDLRAIMEDGAKRLRPMRDLNAIEGDAVLIESTTCSTGSTDNASNAESVPCLPSELE